jgi:hypothetical protein
MAQRIQTACLRCSAMLIDHSPLLADVLPRYLTLNSILKPACVWRIDAGCSCRRRLCSATPMQGPSALTLDLVNVVRRMKLLGFNAIRLPFSFTGASATLPL